MGELRRDALVLVEICSPEHFTLPVDEAARRAYATTKQVVEAVRSAS